MAPWNSFFNIEKEKVVEIHPVVKSKNILTHYDLVMTCGTMELKKKSLYNGL